MSGYDDPEEVAQERVARKEAKSEKALIDAYVQSTLNDVGGRKFLWWLLQIGRWGQSPFLAERSRTDFACGEQNIGLQVMDRILQVDPTGFIRMQSEENERVANRNTTDPDSATVTDSGE